MTVPCYPCYRLQRGCALARRRSCIKAGTYLGGGAGLVSSGRVSVSCASVARILTPHMGADACEGRQAPADLYRRGPLSNLRTTNGGPAMDRGNDQEGKHGGNAAVPAVRGKSLFFRRVRIGFRVVLWTLGIAALGVFLHGMLSCFNVYTLLGWNWLGVTHRASDCWWEGDYDGALKFANHTKGDSHLFLVDLRTAEG